jgi:hypothetical protein
MVAKNHKKVLLNEDTSESLKETYLGACFGDSNSESEYVIALVANIKQSLVIHHKTRK